MESDVPKNIQNRRENFALADKCFVNGTWFEKGIGRPRKPLNKLERGKIRIQQQLAFRVKKKPSA